MPWFFIKNKMRKDDFREMEERNARTAFAKVWRGNLRLQKGLVVTKRDIKERLKRIEERSKKYND